MIQPNTALSILAHPDDAEFVCAGTLALLADRGWQIHIATMTPGNCGSAVLGSAEIAEIRRKEGAAAAEVINGKYRCLESEDCFIRHDKATMLKTVKLIREVRPTIIFAASPSDYLYDHEVTSLIVRDATFWCTVPNIKTPPAAHLESIPHLYYCDPIEGENIFGEPVVPSIVVDVTSVINTKTKMLSKHASQREWLLKQHGTDEYTNAMKESSLKRGQEVGIEFGEGFRQHVGNAYPKDNLLAVQLDRFVHYL